MRFILIVLLMQTQASVISASVRGHTPRSLKKETPSPTASPTIAPTQRPTPSPTAAPTYKNNKDKNDKNNKRDTPQPTSAPSPAPSPAPTRKSERNKNDKPILTNAPTTAPTAAPTVAPTSEPTQAPTAMPTNAPTGELIRLTGQPTSFVRTGLPTLGSTTVEPTVAATAASTDAPTSSPTVASTTAQPTLTATATPTAAPTDTSTGTPTQAPVISIESFPTTSPTDSPTMEPTLSPEASPTKSPSAGPTTTTPTDSPTSGPTIDPESRVVLNEFNVLMTGSGDAVNTSELDATLEEYMKNKMLFYTLDRVSLTLLEGDSTTNLEGVRATSVRFSGMAVFDGFLPNLTDVRSEQAHALGKLDNIQAAIDSNPSLAGVTVKAVTFDRVNAAAAFGREEETAEEGSMGFGIILGVVVCIAMLMIIIGVVLIFRRRKSKANSQTSPGIQIREFEKHQPNDGTSSDSQDAHGCTSLVSHPAALDSTDTKCSKSPTCSQSAADKPGEISIHQDEEYDYDDDYLTMDEDLRTNAESSMYAL